MKLAFATTLLLLGSALAFLPSAEAGICGSSCIEDCHVTVRTGYAAAGCDVGHTPREVRTKCIDGDCGAPITDCHAYEHGRDPYCNAYSLGSMVPPHCQQVFVGPDIDQGICYDWDSSTCKVWWYDTYGTGGGDRCYL